MRLDFCRLFAAARQIRVHVSDDRLREALDAYREAAEAHGASECGDGILQAGQLTRLEEQTQGGILSAEQQRQERARLAGVLLELAGCIERLARRETRIFLSYSHRDPDRKLAAFLHKSLTDKGFEVFFAPEDIAPGEDWYRRIHFELEHCHYFLALVSEHANRSEMVMEELRRAMELRGSRQKPHLLPVRVKLPLDAPLAFDLASQLNRLQNLFWDGEEDNQKVLASLLSVLECETAPIYDREKDALPEDQPLLQESASAPPVPVAPLELPGGAMPAESPYYIIRAGENQFIEGLRQRGAVLRIKGPRQFGKTSLLNRVAARAREMGYQVVVLSFQQLGEEHMQDADLLLRALCQQVARKLRLPPDRLIHAWGAPGGCKDKATYFFEDEALQQPLLLALDEVDRLFSQPAATEVFSLLRAWHEMAVGEPAWENFHLAVSYSTEVHLAIQNLNQSPFNVGDEYRFDPFTEAQQLELVQRHGLSLAAARQAQLHGLLGGHPFMTRKGLYELVSGRSSFDELIAKAPQDDGPFYDHLRALRLRLAEPGQEPCVIVFKRILAGNLPGVWTAEEIREIDRLRAAGLIRGDGATLRPACELYRLYFKDRL